MILDQRGKAIKDQNRTAEIAQSIALTLTEKTLTKIEIQPISKRLKHFKTPTRVNFIKTNGKRGSLLEIVSTDRSGLLAIISRIFRDKNINIHSAKITTFGEKIEDVFTISNSNNQALTVEEQAELSNTLCEELS